MATIVRDFNVPNGATIGTSKANRMRLLGSATGNAVEILAEGLDTDISISLVPKGAGIINIPSSTGLTFAGNTPNTVLYIDSTNAATTTPSFSFDGTNLIVGGTVTANSFIPSSTTIPAFGMYKYASNSVGISTNSTGVIYISAQGQVGIGKIPTAYILETSQDVSINSIRVGLGNSGISSNIVIGNTSLSNTTSGGNNIAVGNNNLHNNITGSNNTSIGNTSLQANLLGSDNVAIGNGTLTNNSTGVLALGVITGGANYINGVYNNVQLIKSSGTDAIVYPIVNITIVNGSVALVTLVSSGSGFTDTTTVLTALTSAIGNNGFGFSVAVATLTSGSNNIGIGYTALYNNIVGMHNIGIGSSTLYSNTLGNNNIGNGFNSLYSNTIGNDNISLGNSSLTTNTTGSSNVAAGSNSLYANLSGSDNIAFGNSASYANTIGIKNISIGTLALSSNLSGNSNVAIGYTAGYNSGVNLTSNSNNTYIGYGATSSINNITNSTAIGNGAIVTKSNQMVFGNTSVTVNYMNGDVLIGTTTNINSSKLVVNGSIEMLSGSIRFPDGTTLSSATAGTLTSFSTTEIAQVSIDSFLINAFRTAKYLIQMSSAVSYHVIELLLIQNGTTVYLAQYGEIFSNLSLGGFDATVSNGNVNLLFTPANAITNLRILRQTLSI